MTEINSRKFSCAPQLEAAVERILKSMGWWDRWSELARQVLELSEVFNRTQIETPWDSDGQKAAYLAYFMPLNSARLNAVQAECSRLKFPVMQTVVDFGAGAGTGQLSWTLPPPVAWIHCEKSRSATELYSLLMTSNGLPHHPPRASLPPLKLTTLLASYVLTELERPPADLLQAESLILVEPSLQGASRNLMEYRSALLKGGFHIWGPCTHQSSCPLLSHSQRDWCHDRIHFQGPSWWQNLSQYLPMRNDTLTFSYLLAAKREPPWSTEKLRARVIGDTLYERGKVRQAVCRGPEREFLAWLTRKGEPEPIPHGELIRLPETIEKKGNELRPENLLARI